MNIRAMRTKTARRKSQRRGWRKSLSRRLVVALCPLIAAWALPQLLFAETGLRPSWTPPLLNGQFRLQLQGQSNQVYEIQVSTNLHDWTAIAAVPASSNGLLRFVDPQAGQFQRRFYRAVARNDLTAAATRNDLTGVGGDGFRMDRVLVKPKPGVDLSSLNLSLGVSVLNVFPAFGNWQVVKTPGHLTPSTLIQSYKASGQVQYAERDYYLEALQTPPVLNDPNDPHYANGDLWSLKNIGQNNGTAGADIRASVAWDTITSASGVIVAVPDTGVRYTHEDLAANMWVNPADGSHGINTVAGNTDPNDDYGHGTHVSGTIGAVGDNGLGVVGVCWRVQIMALKFLDSTGNGTTSDAMVCMDYARTHDAKVVNASWGATFFTSQALHDAVAGLRDANIVFVAAAGNSSANNDTTPLYPASYRDLDNVVAVAATDRNDQLADFSDYGANTVDLAAPGTPILSCWNGSDSDYQDDDGTSMACAHVAGAVALLRAYYPNENYRRIIQRILSNTDPLPSLAGKTITGGRLNLAKALGVASPPALKAGFTETPASGAAPLVALFTDTSTGSPTSWSWSFGDGASSTTQNPSHTYNNAGNFTATLTVANSGGQTNSASQTITVTNAPQTGVMANFSANPTSGQAPLSVQFTDQSSGPVVSWSWNFGDGSSNSTQNPSHTYNNAGTFTATLTVANSAGQTSSASQAITVTNAPQPVSAGFSASPTSGPAPLTVQFTDQSSGPVVSGSWNFGDDSTSATTNPSHTYNNAGTFTATLTVTGSAGQTSSVSHTITVTNAPQPVSARFSASPTSGQAPLIVQFTDQSSGPVVSWNWNFGDGSSNSTQNPSHTYSGAGNFTATLTVANSAGQTSSVSHTITVTNAPQPVSARLSASPTSGQAPLTVQFTDQSTGPVVSGSWNFGDGSSSATTNPSHTYNNAGTFTATLTVTGSGGQTSSASQTITVTNAPQTGVTANFSATPDSGQAPLAVQFTDQSSGPVVSWKWSFGDGASSSAQNPSHTYNNAGTFTATLTVANSAGQTSSVSHTITVTDASQSLSAAFSVSPTSGPAPLGVEFTDQSSGPVVSWRWDFGDGLGSTIQNPYHIYSSPGAYTATLTVTCKIGLTSIASHTITVTSAP
jgi:PKD repeat protein